MEVDLATSRLCTIEGCGKPHVAIGLCNRHYIRQRRHGDTSADKRSGSKGWQWLIEHAAFDGSECLFWPFARTLHGYGELRYRRKTIGAHREMCRLAHGAPPSPKHETAHSCGRGHQACVNPRHLRWATAAENRSDTYLHGTVNRGRRNGRNTLTEDEVRRIRSLRGRVPARAIADAFGVAHQTVHDIFVRRIWNWLD